MAASKRGLSTRVDYKQLDNLTSVVLYDDSPPRKKKGKIYQVERIIGRKKEKQDYQYLIKWAGCPLHECTWEPSAHLPDSLLRGYESPPKPSASRLESTARAFACGVLHLLKSKAICNGYINLDLDCWRYITQGKGTPSEHRGYFLFNKNDFGRLPMLPPDWWYFFNQHGEGKKVDFPMKIKPVIGWSPKKYVFDGKKVIPGPRFPIEKLSVSFARLPCNVKNLFN